MRQARDADPSPRRWSVVLRALREAAGATQEGWAARLGVGRSTLQRWESGDSPPSPEAEAVLLEVCRDRGLLRTYYQGPLRGVTLSAELIRDLLSEARLASTPERVRRVRRAEQLPEPLPEPSSGPRSAQPAPPRTSFIGRERELAEVQRLLGSHRLVTLTGPGGAGKTRLALQVMLAAATWFGDRSWLVDLSALSDADLVPLAMATALGVRDELQQSALEAAIRVLGASSALLVLDNCEHLLTACAHLVDRLLADCPGVRVLATSRQPLSLADEMSWPLGGLESAQAVRLFVERAGAVRPGFALEPDNSAAIERICRRLDGLPLALELAAARTRVLAPAQLADRLDDHLRLLASSNVTAVPRQQTLRATLDWSYELLTPAERALLRRVGVFAGGWTLEAAEGVADDLTDVLELLTSLVTKSLVVADLQATRARYRLLETVRQYAVDKLESAGEGDAARERHLRWFLGLAETAEPHLRAADQALWLDQLDEEVENVRAALSWALVQPDRVGDGLRLAAALRWFWFTRGRPAEGRAWLERGFAAADTVPAVVRGRALDTAAALAHSQGAYAVALRFQAESLSVWRSEGDRQRTAAALSTLGIIAKAQGEHDRARDLLEQALQLAREVGERPTEATVLNNLAALAMDVSDYPRARDFLEESLAIKRELGDAAGIATSLYNLGETAVHLAEHEAAVALLSESLALFRRLSAGDRIAQTLHSLGTVALRRGDATAAQGQFAEALELFKLAGDGWGQALCVEGLASVAEATEQYAQAARLFGAADVWREANGAPVPPNDRAEYDRVLAAAAAALGQTAFTVAWAEGRAAGLDAL